MSLSLNILLPLSLAAFQAPQEASTSRVDLDRTDVLVRVGDRHGRILKVDGDEVTLEFVQIPGSRATVDADVLPAEKLYMYHRASCDEDSAESWRKLAKFAAKHDLPRRRIEALEEIKELEPDQGEALEKKIESIRAECATERLEQAKELRASGELDEAIDHLEETVEEYEGCDATERAREMLKKLRANLKDEQKQAERTRERRAAVRKANKQLDDVARLLDKGRKAMRRGQESAGEYVAAKNHLEDAVAYFEAARERLSELDAQRGPKTGSKSGNEQPEDSIADEHRNLTRTARRDLVRAHIELGHVYIARGDSPAAYRHAGRAAALDPDSSRVARLRQAIAARDRGN